MGTYHIMFISDVIQTLSQDRAVPEIVRLSQSTANASRHFFVFCFWLCYVPSKSVLIYVTLIIFVIIIIIIIIWLDTKIVLKTTHVFVDEVPRSCSCGCCGRMCSGSVVVTVTAYDFESVRPGSSPERGQYTISLRSLHTARAYSSLHPFGVVHWAHKQLNIKAVTGACKLIDGCSL